jgi:hypothetical protein
MGAPRAAVTSSTDAVVIVERIWRCPFAFAALATATSPSEWNAIWLPTGASTIGVSQTVPKSRMDRSTLETSTSRRGRIWIRENASRFARSVTSSSTPDAR